MDQIYTPPQNNVDITELCTEALVMIWIFLPNYLHHAEGGMVSAARAELVRRGVIGLKDNRIVEWNLDEDTREELADIWVVDRMAETFRYITKPPRKRK